MADKPLVRWTGVTGNIGRSLAAATTHRHAVEGIDRDTDRTDQRSLEIMAVNCQRRPCQVKQHERIDMTKRPNNREVEDEMVCPPGKDGEPPRPATQPKKPGNGDPEDNSRS